MFNKKISPSDFIARGKVKLKDVSVPVIVHGTYNSYEPTPVLCTISPDGRRKTLGGISDFNNIEIKATTNEGEEIRILGLEQVRVSHIDSKTIWKGTASYFIKGQLGNFGAKGSTVHCSIFIPYTPLATAEVNYTPSYDGTITLDGKSKREGIKWETTLGQVELIDNYQYVEDKVGIDKATVRIRKCQAHLIVNPKGRFSLEKLLKELPDYFDETFWLISFLSRKRIVWYGVDVMALPSEGNSGFRRALAHRRSWLGFQVEQFDDQTWIDLLVKLSDLRNGQFEEIHKNYQVSRYKTLIRRTIPFLLMSYEQGYFESHIANTYSALETMVAGLSEDEDRETGNSLPSKDFKRLSKKLKAVIYTEVNDKEISAGIIGKLGELNRRPILRRLIALLRKHNVPTEKIWSTNIAMETELGKIIKRRNLYIHQGRIDDFGQYYDDYTRLRILVELWILKLLECPNDSINEAALQVSLRR